MRSLELFYQGAVCPLAYVHDRTALNPEVRKTLFTQKKSTHSGTGGSRAESNRSVSTRPPPQPSPPHHSCRACVPLPQAPSYSPWTCWTSVWILLPRPPATALSAVAARTQAEEGIELQEGKRVREGPEAEEQRVVAIAMTSIGRPHIQYWFRTENIGGQVT